MKSIFLLPALLSSIYVLSAPAPIPNPEPYIVTKYVEETATYTYRGYTQSSSTILPSVDISTKTVVPTDTPTNGLRTVTDSTSYAEVTIIEILLPPGSAPKITSSSLDLYGTDDAYVLAQSTRYVVPVTYTPLASCTSRYSGQSWALTTNIPISIPFPVRGAITPLSLLASTSTYTDNYDKLSLITSQYAVLNPTDIPSAALASALSLYEPNGLANCYTPTTACYTVTYAEGEREATCRHTFTYDSNYRSTFSGNDPYPEGYTRDSRWRVYSILILVLAPFTWLLFFFLLGLLESYLSFKGLMLGKHRKRGVPYTWCCVSLFTLCCVGPTYKAKSAEEQVILGERWKEYKKREKFKLWVKWGLKWKYPDVLGEAPEIDKRALRERCL